MKLSLIAFSEAGFQLGARLAAQLIQAGDAAELSRCEDGGLESWTAGRFSERDALVFIGACGIAVRAIAPWVSSKTRDPAVLVLDEAGHFCISLLSGHIGGANALTLRLAEAVGAIPVVTTATDLRRVFAVDSWAAAKGLRLLNPERIKRVSGRLLSGKPVRLKCDYPILGALPEGIQVAPGDEIDLLISHRRARPPEALQLVPPVVTLGVGCRRGVPLAAIEAAFEAALVCADCVPEAVCRIATVDLKAREAGLLEFSRVHRLPLEIFTAAELAAVPGEFSASDFVKSVAGVDNVCERSAVCASGGQLLLRKTAAHGVTMALARKDYEIRF